MTQVTKQEEINEIEKKRDYHVKMAIQFSELVGCLKRDMFNMQKEAK